MFVDLDKLRSKHASLFELVVRTIGFNSGIREIGNQHIDNFTNEAKRKLNECVAPPPPDFNQRLRELKQHQEKTLKEQKELPLPPQRDLLGETRASLESAAANGRLLQLQDENGLIDNEANGKLIGDYFRNNKLTFTVKNVNAAITALRADLVWHRKEAPAAPVVPVAPPPVVPAPAEPPAAEVLGTLPDNSQQLPLGTTPSKKHTVAQLRDLDKRQAGLRRPAGSFGSRF